MTRQRLSREQSREQTRERLLEAAHTVFTQKGFALASVEDITAAAGYSRGAFYSNFDDKIELFFELLLRESVEIDADIQRMLDAPMTDPVQVRQEIADYYGKMYQDDMCSLLWMEARIVALRDEKFRVRFNTFLDERHKKIAMFVEIFSQLTGEPPAAPPHQIAIGLMALCEGVSFAHRCDPERIDGKTAEAVLSWFLTSSIAMPPAAGASAQEPVLAQRKPAKSRSAQ
jgi:AcrR family transcriptional regulator